VEAILRPWTTCGQILAARDVARFVRGWLRGQPPGRGTAVVHTHGVWTPAIIAAAHTALSAGVPLVVSPRGMLRREALRRSRLIKSFVWHMCVRRILTRAAAVHVTSSQEAQDLARLLPGIEPVLVPWGIEPWGENRNQDPRASPRVAAYLGRMLPIKGLDMLIDAWAVMAAALQARIASHGLGDVIRLEPAVPHSQVPAFLAEIDLFVLPSRSENFALSVGEALAAGVPVVTTTETAWAGVDAMGCGWCVTPDTNSIAGALRAATSQPITVLREMGRRGAVWVKRDFTWSAVADRLVQEVYTAS
jgi:glycosyltransferase involved in cell wall biosynthesis